MQAKASQLLYAYWNDVRGVRIAPRRLEIEPARISDLLPDTFILERHDAHTYRFRLAGTRICDTFGAELRGSNFLEGWSGEDRVEIEHVLSEATAQGAVGILEIEAETPDKRRSARFEVIFLPLVHMRPDADRVLGSIVCTDDPAWLGTEKLQATRLVQHEIVWPDGRPRAMLDGLNRQAPFLPEIRHARLVRVDRRQFRVYDGGRSNEERQEH